jgi:hypothetical protein
VENERRNSLEQIPLRQIEDISLQIATWLRMAFEQFLGSETRSLMGIKDLGEFKHSAIERFRGILHTVVKSSIKTDSPIPPWAATQVIEAWNVPNFMTLPGLPIHKRNTLDRPGGYYVPRRKWSKPGTCCNSSEQKRQTS